MKITLDQLDQTGAESSLCSRRSDLWRRCSLFLTIVATAIAWTNIVHARPAPESFADLAAQVLPSVVDVRVVEKTTQATAPGPEEFGLGLPPDGSFNDLQELFDYFRRFGPNGVRPPQVRIASGSGFIIDQGVIVTNNHVIENGAEIFITFRGDQKEYPAEVVGADPGADLAVLRVKTDHPMHAVRFGDSDAARIGDWALAVGNPWGLGGSVTVGVISARGRDINPDSLVDFIQTDAAINQGNSGGPLFNAAGEVIGINTVIFSKTGGSIGLGFAIPSNHARQVVDQLLRYGETRRGWLGVSMQSVTPDIAESVGLKTTNGALVTSVYDQSPAAKAGLQSGDIVLRFDNQDVENASKFRRMVAASDAGRTVALTVWRDGRQTAIKVTLGQREKVDFAKLEDKGAPSDGVKMAALGLSVATVDDQTRQRLGLSAMVNGVVILEVGNDSDTARKGVQPGMVIIADNIGPVTTVEELARHIEIIKASGRKAILVRLLTRRGSLALGLRLADGAP